MRSPTVIMIAQFRNATAPAPTPRPSSSATTHVRAAAPRRPRRGTVAALVAAVVAATVVSVVAFGVDRPASDAEEVSAGNTWS